MNSKLKLAVVTLAVGALAACGTGTAVPKNKKPVDYKTPPAATATSSPTTKLGDKCKKSGEKITVNGQKMICKKVGKFGTRKWYKD